MKVCAKPGERTEQQRRGVVDGALRRRSETLVLTVLAWCGVRWRALCWNVVVQVPDQRWKGAVMVLSGAFHVHLAGMQDLATKW